MPDVKGFLSPKEFNGFLKLALTDKQFGADLAQEGPLVAMEKHGYKFPGASPETRELSARLARRPVTSTPGFSLCSGCAICAVCAICGEIDGASGVLGLSGLLGLA